MESSRSGIASFPPSITVRSSLTPFRITVNGTGTYSHAAPDVKRTLRTACDFLASTYYATLHPAFDKGVLEFGSSMASGRSWLGVVSGATLTAWQDEKQLRVRVTAAIEPILLAMPPIGLILTIVTRHWFFLGLGAFMYLGNVLPVLFGVRRLVNKTLDPY